MSQSAPDYDQRSLLAGIETLSSENAKLRHKLDGYRCYAVFSFWLGSFTLLFHFFSHSYLLELSFALSFLSIWFVYDRLERLLP